MAGSGEGRRVSPTVSPAGPAPRAHRSATLDSAPRGSRRVCRIFLDVLPSGIDNPNRQPFGRSDSPSVTKTQSRFGSSRIAIFQFLSAGTERKIVRRPATMGSNPGRLQAEFPGPEQGFLFSVLS